MVMIKEIYSGDNDDDDDDDDDGFKIPVSLFPYLRLAVPYHQHCKNPFFDVKNLNSAQ